MSSLPIRESLPFALRALYDCYGYTRYKMNKFEEYDLYARNKDFLISQEVITFTDTNGRLMALKPDVTLSIVKNTRDNPGSVQKLYYTENVYRISKGTHAYKEIPQVGLEAIGDVDDYCLYEVLKLAAESLSQTQRSCVLEISHLGLLEDVLNHAGIPRSEQPRIIRCIGEKNPHELRRQCKALEIPEEKTSLLLTLTGIYGTPEEILPRLKTLLAGIVQPENWNQFYSILSALNDTKWKDMLRIDFSAVSDLRYYNGFVFKGFAQGIPDRILSGGQYDTLMKKMKRQSGAVGFAVYLDLLEQYTVQSTQYDVDTLLLYKDGDTLEAIEAVAKQLGREGKSILVQREVPPGIRYRELRKVGECNA